MLSIRIWALGSTSDDKQVRCSVNELAGLRQPVNLSIHVSDRKAFPRPEKNGTLPSDRLQKATRTYLKQDDCVIFFLDDARQQKSEAFINQFKEIVADSEFAGKAFFAPGVDELEALLWRTRLEIEDPDRAARMDYAEAQFRQLCASRGLDWDAMPETERENFVDDLIHEDRECSR